MKTAAHLLFCVTVPCVVALCTLSCGGQNDNTESNSDDNLQVYPGHTLVLRAPGPLQGASVAILDATLPGGLLTDHHSTDMEAARQIYQQQGIHPPWQALSPREKLSHTGIVDITPDTFDPESYYLIVTRDGQHLDSGNDPRLSQFNGSLRAFARGADLRRGIFVTPATDACYRQVTAVPPTADLGNLLDICARSLLPPDNYRDGQMDYRDILLWSPDADHRFPSRQSTASPTENEYWQILLNQLVSNTVVPSTEAYFIDNLASPGKSYGIPHSGHPIQDIIRGYPTTLVSRDHPFMVGDQVLLQPLHGMLDFDGKTVTVLTTHPDSFDVDFDSTYHPPYHSGGLAYWQGPLVLEGSAGSTVFSIVYGNSSIVSSNGWGAVLQSDEKLLPVTVIRREGLQLTLDRSSVTSIAALSGTLYSRHRQALGQHYSYHGYGAYAWGIWKRLRSLCLGADSASRPVFDTSVLILPRNAWLIDAPATFDNSHIRNVHNDVFSLIHTIQKDALRIFPGSQQPQIRYLVPSTPHTRTLSLSAGFYTTDNSGPEFGGVIQSWINDMLVEEITFGMESATLHAQQQPGQQLDIRVKVNNDELPPGEIRISELRVRRAPQKAGNEACQLQKPRILLLGDSWFDSDRYPGVRTTLESLARTENAEVQIVDRFVYEGKIIKTGHAGTTVKYALAWITQILDLLKPDIIIVNYFTNDANSINGTTLPIQIGPNGTPVDINIADRQDYVAALIQLVQHIQASGAIPIVMGPDITASAAQTTRHIELNNSLPW